MATLMSKPPKITRPTKPPLILLPEGDTLIGDVGLIHEKLVGRTVIAWAKLEAAMGDLVWFMLGVNMDVGRFVTSRMEANSIIRMLRDIAPIKLTEEKWHVLSPI